MYILKESIVSFYRATKHIECLLMGSILGPLLSKSNFELLSDMCEGSISKELLQSHKCILCHHHLREQDLFGGKNHH